MIHSLINTGQKGRIALDFRLMTQASQKYNLNEILTVAQTASKEGASVLRNYFGNLESVQEKSDSSIVSEADRESERVITRALSQKFPNFSVYGEEGGLVESTHAEGTWYIDPLDGTTNFVHGFPYFSTSLGLEIDGKIMVAVIDAPFLNLSLWAVRGGGAYKNGKRISVSQTSVLENSLLSTGFSVDKNNNKEKQVEIFAHFLGKTRGIRRPGAAALDMCFTACGVFDAFWEKNLKPWDTAAGSLLVEEAGGVVTTLDGSAWSVHSDSILVGTPKIHSAIISEIKKSKNLLL